MKRKLPNTTEWFHRNILRKDETEWDFGIPDDQWWNKVIKEGEPVRILRDGDEYLCGVYKFRDTYHLFGFSEGLPFPDRQNAWFDISVEDAYRVMDFMLWKRRNYPQKSRSLDQLFGFLLTKDWKEIVHKYCELDDVEFLEVESL